jgi:hypothetical protein
MKTGFAVALQRTRCGTVALTPRVKKVQRRDEGGQHGQRRGKGGNAKNEGKNVHVQQLVCAIGTGLIFHSRNDSFRDAVLLLYAASSLYALSV